MNNKPHSEETKRKISLSLMGHVVTEHTRKKLRKANLGFQRPEEIKIKIAHSMKGVNTWMKGRRNSPATQFKKGHMAGEKHPMWKGGVTPLNQKIRQSFEYKQWRTTIFKRDNFTCQICGVRGLQLNADHIETFAMLLRKHGITDVQTALICTELWDIKNGRTLCVSCHRKTPTWGNRVNKAILMA